ncbi:HEAT repeat domain-containing protein [Pyrococcus yayanosii]|uniref:Clathrin/coatomer adaptor adaptin-like N-terminal domain-containing protein n=1 Tax=Pyrococcus yayanosii (strain CH1 / JCM 16557) TaxID=529709 RepID=F8AF99_PYRYC|nr:HEAT repeat domain-containing protein [Pyrococcus yayanosii]AEH24929.1 hypothetical protein PYCH_12530 [Pyrococcus yayanosii CH1]
MGEVVKLACSSEDVLRMLIELVRDKDRNVRIGALMALKEILSTMGDPEKLFVVKESLEAILLARNPERARRYASSPYFSRCPV